MAPIPARTMSSLPASSSLRPVCVRPDPAPSLPVGRPWSLPLSLLIALSLTGCSSDAIKAPEAQAARPPAPVAAAPDAATPTTRLAVEMRPSLAPSTAARNQPMCSVRCRS